MLTTEQGEQQFVAVRAVLVNISAAANRADIRTARAKATAIAAEILTKAKAGKFPAGEVMRVSRYSDAEKRAYWVGVGVALERSRKLSGFLSGLDDTLFASCNAGYLSLAKKMPQIKRRGQNK